MQKCMLVFMLSGCQNCPIEKKFGMVEQFLVKFSSVKFYENPSSSSRVVSCLQMDR